MSDTVWIRHPDIDGLTEVPAQSLPHYRQSGWDEAPKKDVAAHQKAQDDERAAAEQAMTDAAARNSTDAPQDDASGRDDTPHTEES